MSVELQDVSGLPRGVRLRVELIGEDHPRASYVIPEHRGARFEGRYRGVSRNRTGSSTEFMLDVQAEDSKIVYSFNDFLIESVKVIGAVM